MSSGLGKSKEEKFRPTSSGMDAELQAELNDALGEMSLDQIIEAEDAAKSAGKPAAVKGVRRGTVVDIQGDDIFVDMGGKSQGILPATQFNEDQPLPKIGSAIEVTIEGYDNADGFLILSRQGAVTAAAWQTLAEGQILEGRVTDHNKGGLELTIDGIRAFMPISQIELFRVTDISGYVNQRIRCQVIEVDHEDRKVVVSRRAILELEAQETREKTFASLVEGKIVTGVVKSIMPYGAFVDIGGFDGLLHVRDMSHARVEDPKTVVKEGQTLEVKILKVDREARKIGLGLKQVMADPWTDVTTKWPIDSLVSGRITRLADFGAFVELEPGVEGLVPISEMTFERRLKHPSDIVKVGEVIRIRVINVDPEKHRIGLSMKRVGVDPWMGASSRWPVNSIVSGRVTRLTEFGAFVEVTPGVEGLVHISELSHERVRTVSEAVKEGQSIQAKVLTVDEDARRISLSIKQVTSLADYTGPETAEPTEPVKPAKKRKIPLKGGLG